MIATITPALISGNVIAPVSKSVMQRACALALLNNGTTTILNPGNSNDDRAAIAMIKKCGALVTELPGKLMIESNGNVNASQLHCGESGLSLRMFAPIAALSPQPILLTGEGSLLGRPIELLQTMLEPLGVAVSTTNGFLPVRIQGPLVASDLTIDGSQSSQYVTGLLFALAKAAKRQVTLSVSKATSRPYINLSVEMARHFGYKVNALPNDQYVIEPASKGKKNILFKMEGDWSGAAFLLVAAAVCRSQITVAGLNLKSTQADKAIIEVLQTAGVEITMQNESITVPGSSKLLPFSFDATDCPDLFPPLVALAAYCKGISSIKGLHRLITKESNRSEALADVFAKMGIEIERKDDNMLVHGTGKLLGGCVSGHHDHRIVMAASIAALGASDNTIISGAEAIDKSYPFFFHDIKALGAIVSLQT